MMPASVRRMAWGRDCRSAGGCYSGGLRVIIEVEDLRKVYRGGARPALAGIDLRIEKGGVVGILGPNGAGKTTFVEILEGLRTPTSGRVNVLGVDPARQARALKERIGVQLQSTAIPGDLRVREVLELYAAFYARARPVGAVLQQVDLLEKAGALTRTLSGGQKQRLALGMALVHDPELVLLDEPTTGLDPVARRGLHHVVEGLKAEGRSIILTTHYLEEAEKLCGRVIVIRDGEVVADGTPMELASRASGVTTLWIALEGENAAADLAPLRAAGVTEEGREGAYRRFTTADPTAAVLALAEGLRAQNLTLADIRMRRPTLEDFYLELVGETGREETQAAPDAGA